jgi:RNA polymerase sigma-70 factor, ECF subfamily
MDWVSLSAEDLVRKCVESEDAEAWDEFMRRFHPHIARVVLRVARRWSVRSPQLIDEWVQETYAKLCADNFSVLRKFKSQHPDAFYGYLKVVTANCVHDLCKAAHSAKRDLGAAQVEQDPETMAAADCSGTPAAGEIIERQILLQEFDALLQRLAQGPNLERDRRVFWLYYRTGLAASDIAALPSIGLSTKGVESTILRLTRLLRSEMTEGKAFKKTEGI